MEGKLSGKGMKVEMFISRFLENWEMAKNNKWSTPISKYLFA